MEKFKIFVFSPILSHEIAPNRVFRCENIKVGWGIHCPALKRLDSRILAICTDILNP